MSRGADVSGIVLAGGKSRRMGVDKAELELHGQTLLERVIASVSEVAGEVVVVGRRVNGFLCVPDRIPDAGPLAGIAEGLRTVQHQVAVVVACDMPFLRPELLSYLVSLQPGYDAVVPLLDGKAEPLHAVYTRDVAGQAGLLVEQGERRLGRLLDVIRVRWVTEKEIAALDPDRRSFLNINTRREWKRMPGL